MANTQSFYNGNSPTAPDVGAIGTDPAEVALALAQDDAARLDALEPRVDDLEGSQAAQDLFISDLYALIANLTTRVLTIEQSGGGSVYAFRLDFNDARNMVLLPPILGI